MSTEHLAHPAQKTWLITGVSSGFGKALATTLLSAGQRVVGTLRNEQSRQDFEQLKPGYSFGCLLDVTDNAGIPGAIAEIESRIGAIDVLVNNAGYGHEGLIEESSLEDFRQQFEVNVFGAVAMIKAVLPFMRERRRGHILNITSMGGLTTFPGLGAYHGSKFALEGISETLGKEVRPFGIAVTAIEPGAFRTDWAGRSMVRAERSIGDYDASFDGQRKARLERSGQQAGDPLKAALAIMQVVASPMPPTHLLLGRDAVQLVKEKLTMLQAEIQQWETLSQSTDYS
ncbi:MULTISPECIES: oxidoreductase [Pseudomonas]|uniref:Oxidoreductase n=1 Tax=Pseudomonas gingeri TaxID=117681 RepID=A0A7Y7WSF5_9PSED|nr:MULTISPECIES: oxidoreductase [Pseudomonas]MPQ70486.1 SDR family NAD(P)-dependent oxidoreductase [Pseudomonas sp. MWU12-2323]NWB86874.1 oxidoreductase [Pseudomonas gingeri]